MKNLIFISALTLMLSSCYCDKVFVGDINPHDELVHVASARNAHVIAGAMVTKNNANHFVGNTKDYVVATKHTFGDMLLQSLSFGIYTPTTTKYYVKKDHPNVVVEKKKKWSKAYKGYLK